MINGFVVVENDTQLELTQGNVVTRFVPLEATVLEIQQEEPELLYTLYLVNAENSADQRSFTLDVEEKDSIGAFLQYHNLI
jgi:hypothetical protein